MEEAIPSLSPDSAKLLVGAGDPMTFAWRGNGPSLILEPDCAAIFGGNTTTALTLPPTVNHLDRSIAIAETQPEREH